VAAIRERTMEEQQETVEQELPPYIIEGARSGRSRCKTCRRAIRKGALRLGIRIEGPYGTGYLWHHLKCAARRQFDRVEEAYGLEAWKEAKKPPARIPDLAVLRHHADKADERRRQRKTPPYAELDPSGRAACKQCGQPVEKGAVRVVLGRQVRFGNQVRTAPIHVHARCVPAALRAEDNATEPEGLEEALRASSSDLPSDKLEAALLEIRQLV
jgi:poly [ADP-ribose] polymerase